MNYHSKITYFAVIEQTISGNTDFLLQKPAPELKNPIICETR